MKRTEIIEGLRSRNTYIENNKYEFEEGVVILNEKISKRLKMFENAMESIYINELATEKQKYDFLYCRYNKDLRKTIDFLDEMNNDFSLFSIKQFEKLKF